MGYQEYCGTSAKITSGCWQSSKSRENATHCDREQICVNRTTESWELGFRKASSKRKTATKVLVILEPGKMSELYTGLTEPAT